MRALCFAILTGVVAHPSISWADPLTVRHSSEIRVAIKGHTEEAFALAGTANGWRLDLTGVAKTATVTVRDVTSGVPSGKYELSLVGGGILLDTVRFRADHAYRIELRKGESVVGSALIYLRPPRQNGRVVFDTREAAKTDADGELGTFDKGSL
jgi:hypothetical protein